MRDLRDTYDRLRDSINATDDLARELRNRAGKLDEQTARLRGVRDEIASGADMNPLAVAGVLASTARDVTDTVTHTPQQLGFLNYLLADGAAQFAAQKEASS